jgi:ABC-type amino acid transport substrate-binding protein
MMFAIPVLSGAQSRLDKVKRTKKLEVGAREGIPPFGFYDEKGQWVGWSMELSRALHRVISKKLGMDIELIFKPVTPQTRIPLIVNGTLDWYLGSAAISIEREGPVDFSVVIFSSIGALMMRKGTPINMIKDLGGKRVGCTAGGLEERRTMELIKTGAIKPAATVTTFSDQAGAFLASQQEKIDVLHANDIFLEGLRAKAPRPGDWEIKTFPEELGFNLNGVIVPKNDSDWRDMVNHSLCYIIKSGEYQKIWDDWFGQKNPKAGFSLTHRDPLKTVVYWQCWEGTEEWLK